MAKLRHNNNGFTICLQVGTTLTTFTILNMFSLSLQDDGINEFDFTPACPKLPLLSEVTPLDGT